MLIDVVVISKLCSELVDTCTVDLPTQNDLVPLPDLFDVLHDHYGPHNEASLWWRYSEDVYFPICNYASLQSALHFGAERRVYVLLKDYEEPWQDNGVYMRTLDYVSGKMKARENADPYDVRIMREDDIDSEAQDEELLADSQGAADCRTDADVMAYACLPLGGSPYYTMDFATQAHLIESLKRGSTKDKRRLERPPEVVIERASMKKSGRGGGDKVRTKSGGGKKKKKK